ncbi:MULTISPECIES: hypothetical protein [Chitinophaga]|nr:MULTISPECIES: hypothetical protein [Chitinophaga]
MRAQLLLRASGGDGGGARGQDMAVMAGRKKVMLVVVERGGAG